MTFNVAHWETSYDGLRCSMQNDDITPLVK